MAKSLTVRLPNGATHTYENVPEGVTQEQAQARADKEFGGATPAADVDEEARGGIPYAIDKKTGKIRPLSTGEKLVYGFGLGARNVGMNLANMLGMMSPEKVTSAKAEGAPITEKFPGNVGAFVGESAALAPVGMGAGGLVTRLGVPARGVLAGMTEGATQGAVSAGPDDRFSGAMTGGAIGGAIPGGIKMAQALARGTSMTPNARRLAQRGVDLTPGQMNPEGTVAMTEELLQGVPVIGPRIKQQRAQSWAQTQNLIAQEAAPPGFTMQPRSDQNVMFRDLMDAYNQAYEVGKGYPMLPVIRPDKGPDIPLTKALQVPRNAVGTDQGRDYAASVLNNELSSLRGLGSKLQSDDLLDMRSRIRSEIRSLQKMQNAPVGAENILQNAESKITAALDSQLPAGVKDQIKSIDQKYGNFKVVQTALERAKDRPEGFTQSQFSEAVRANTPSRMGYAAGGGRMRDIAKAGADVFQPRQPMTGRQLGGLVATGAATTGAGSVAPVMTTAALGLGALPYLPGPIGKAARSAITGQTDVQQAVRQAERSMRRALSPQEREAIIRFLQTTSIAASDNQ